MSTDRNKYRRDYARFLSDSAPRPFGFRTAEDAGEDFPSVAHGMAYMKESSTESEWERCREHVLYEMRLFSFLDPRNAEARKALFRNDAASLEPWLRDIRNDVASRRYLDALGTPNPCWEGRRKNKKEKSLLDVFKKI